MKITKLILGFGLAITLVSCGTTKQVTSKQVINKTVKYSGKLPSLEMVTNHVVAKKGKMTKEEIQNWPHMDIFKDSVPGMSLAKAYEFLRGRDGKTVIVGIIDSGIDIEHEDLKDVIWTNPKEIAGNGKDDDNNGYIDDIHGWNFLGGKKGSKAPEQLEITRIVKSMLPKFEGKTADQISDADKADFEKFTDLKKKVFDRATKAAGQKEFYKGLHKTIADGDAAIKKALGKDTYTLEEVTNLNSEDKAIKDALNYLPRMLGGGATVKESIDQIKGGVDYFSSQADYMYNLDFNGRIQGDNPLDFNDRNYGNNIVLGAGPDELHGTHVAGIVAASRNNGIGMNGVAKNVKIMVARAVPDGDEYDKDVALAIRYVVDNGAKVVNMSFGKGYSPNSEWVYDAIKYAAKHDVLLVKAAGNDGKDIDNQDYLHYPTDSPVNGATEIADNVLCVGAMTRHFDDKLCATFSNYGKTRVDIFAPGLEIYSTVPHNDYKSIQGTSMASPEVAGVAALVRSYYPNLTASQVKHIIMNSGIEFHRNVIVPGSKGEETKSFDDLSVNGRILNAYNALIMADQMSK